MTMASGSVLKFTTFSGSHTIKLAFVGDVLLHGPLIRQSKIKGVTYLWHNALPYIHQADIAVANLEGPIAAGVDRNGRFHPNSAPWDLRLYTGYPLFNYPPELALALSRSDFKILTTANNHALDRYALGVDKTVSILKKYHLLAAGSRMSVDPSDSRFVTTNSKGFRIAWIACTTSTNGIKDTHKQIMRCYKKADRREIKNIIARLRNRVDAIIILPHWGQQYHTVPDTMQKRFAKQMLNAGALMVIGTHPHVLQPWKKYITTDHRDTFVAYSLGNFVSNQGSPRNRATAILLVTLQKNRHGTTIRKVNYQPAYMQNRSGLGAIRLDLIHPGDRHRVAWRIIHSVLPRV